MIPTFDDNGNLPPGEHVATLAEIQQRFVYNQTRRKLFAQLKLVVQMLRKSHCREIYLDGSYVTTKENPNDYDLCWEPTGITATEQIRELLKNPDLLKQEFLGDIKPRLPQPPYHMDYVDYWQSDTEGNAKGIIKIILRTA